MLCLLTANVGGLFVEAARALEAAQELAVPQTVEAVPTSEEIKAESQAGSELFVMYVYAALRVEPWAEYTKTIAKAHKEAEVLNKFGLTSADALQALTDRKLAAAEQLKRLTLLKSAAYEELIGSYKWRVGSSAVQAAVVVADPKAALLLKQAQLNEKKASTEVATANLQVKSGTLDTLTALDKQEAYLQAKMSTIEAKSAYCLSLVSAYMAESGSAMSLSAFLEAIDQQEDGSVKKDWMRIISQFAIQVALSASPILRDNGEVYVPLRPFAEALHYEMEWDPLQSQITIIKGDNRIRVTINQNLAVKNDQVILLHSAPYVHNEYTYVPLLFFTDMLGVEVYWSDRDGQLIIIQQLIGEEG
jgi:hypothetical protein